MKRFMRCCGLAAGLLFGATAQAGLITDTEVGIRHLNHGQTGTITHNLNDNVDFTAGTVLSGTLAIQLFDDRASCEGMAECLVELIFGIPADFESARVTVGALNLETGLGLWSGSLDFGALAAVNTGVLNITLEALTGDFMVGSSVLSLVTRDVFAPAVTAVPAPASLALISLGLFILSSARKRLGQTGT